MQTVLIVFHLMVVIGLVATVLLQRSEGGALGVGGGGGFMTGRGQANALTRATAILGTLFFITSLSLTLLAHYNRAPKSIIDTVPNATQSQPSVPAAPGANAARSAAADGAAKAERSGSTRAARGAEVAIASDRRHLSGSRVVAQARFRVPASGRFLSLE